MQQNTYKNYQPTYRLIYANSYFSRSYQYGFVSIYLWKNLSMSISIVCSFLFFSQYSAQSFHIYLSIYRLFFILFQTLPGILYISVDLSIVCSFLFLSLLIPAFSYLSIFILICSYQSLSIRIYESTFLITQLFAFFQYDSFSSALSARRKIHRLYLLQWSKTSPPKKGCPRYSSQLMVRIPVLRSG